MARQMTPLSPVMMSALRTAKAHGGALLRSPGGYWSYRDCPTRSDQKNLPLFVYKNIPVWHVSGVTVNALVDRGMFEQTRFKESRTGAFCIRVELTLRGQEACGA